jgi:hypothetical protein
LDGEVDSRLGGLDEQGVLYCLDRFHLCPFRLRLLLGRLGSNDRLDVSLRFDGERLLLLLDGTFTALRFFE